MEDVRPKKKHQNQQKRKRKPNTEESDEASSSKKSKRGITRAEVLKFKVWAFLISTQKILLSLFMY
jgi:hypothetical protein